MNGDLNLIYAVVAILAGVSLGATGANRFCDEKRNHLDSTLLFTVGCCLFAGGAVWAACLVTGSSLFGLN